MEHTPGPVETLARLTIQSARYGGDPDFRDAVDTVLGNPVYDAAPELLAALIVLEDHASETYPHFENPRGQNDLVQARTAIHNATKE